jgi:hypothetical protein
VAGTGSVLTEPTQELLTKHRSSLVNALSVDDSRNNRSDLGTVLVRGCAAFEQPDRICVIDRALDGCDEALKTRFITKG